MHERQHSAKQRGTHVTEIRQARTWEPRQPSPEARADWCKPARLSEGFDADEPVERRKSMRAPATRSGTAHRSSTKRFLIGIPVVRDLIVPKRLGVSWPTTTFSRFTNSLNRLGLAAKSSSSVTNTKSASAARIDGHLLSFLQSREIGYCSQPFVGIGDREV